MIFRFHYFNTAAILIAAIFASACHAKTDKADSNIAKLNLKGSIESLIEYKFDYSDLGWIDENTLSPLLKSFDNTVASYEFDHDGMITYMLDVSEMERIYYEYDNVLRVSRIKHDYILEDSIVYNDFEWKKGRLAQEEILASDGRRISSIEYEYDKSGREKLTKMYDGTAEMWRFEKYLWTQDGGHCERKLYSANDESLIRTVAVDYSDKRLPIKRIVSDSETCSIEEFRYDDEGRVVYHKCIVRGGSEDGSMEREKSFIYNGNGDLISEHSVSVGESMDRCEYTLSYDYVYDNAGNWVWAYAYSTDLNGKRKLLYSRYRDISYFD